MSGRRGVGYRLALKLSAVVVLFVVASLFVVERITRGGEVSYQQGQLFLYLASAGVGGILFAGVLDLLVTRPVMRLLAQVRVAAKTGWAAPLEIRGGDEIAELGDALEALRGAVVAQRGELEALNADLERRVQERTRQLEAAQNQLIQAEKMASLGQLAAGVAHEVNNPNGVVLSRAGYLLSVADEEGLDPDVIDDLQVIEDQAKRVARIAGSLLQFARPGARSSAPVALATVAELTCQVLGHTAKKAQVTLTVEVGDRVCVDGDRGRLEQVVFNLVINAIHATPPGGAITVRAAGGRLEVEDTGVGIPEDQVSRIFDPFFTTKEPGEGTGLGLSVTYGIVHEHGGTIRAVSGPGRGTLMVVELPTTGAHP